MFSLPLVGADATYLSMMLKTEKVSDIHEMFIWFAVISKTSRFAELLVFWFHHVALIYFFLQSMSV